MHPLLTVPRLTATSFRHQLSSGRTRPCVFGCETEAGQVAGEYVVKLRSRMDLGDRAAIRELVASLVARVLGLDVPDPAIVEIESGLADGIPQIDVRGDVSSSAGLNFGSRYLSGGYAAWQPHQPVPQRMIDRAFEVFSFDALVDNPDRRPQPSNLLTDGERIVVIDHESAFSFLLALARPKDPWKLVGMGYLTGHVFYASLRSLLMSGERIRAALAALTLDDCAGIEAAVPADWWHEDARTIRVHIETMAAHADDFIIAVKALLR